MLTSEEVKQLIAQCKGYKDWVEFSKESSVKKLEEIDKILTNFYLDKIYTKYINTIEMLVIVKKTLEDINYFSLGIKEYNQISNLKKDISIFLEKVNNE